MPLKDNSLISISWTITIIYLYVDSILHNSHRANSLDTQTLSRCKFYTLQNLGS